MALQNFDEVNILKRRSIPYDQYFGEMELSAEQRAERKELAYWIEDIVIIFFIMFQDSLVSGNVDEATIKQNLIYDLYENLTDANYFGEPDDKKAEAILDEYIINFAEELYKSTQENLDKSPDDYDYKGETPYWLSEDRAIFIAENEANTLCNSKDYIKAKQNGKTHKIWMAFPDDRVRTTHVQANGSKVPIDDYFSVGGARMLFPKDITSEFSTGSDHPEEVINCRCQVKYV